MNVDLHCHSTNSDGTWSVAQILQTAESKGVQALAITDHDNFQGSLEANSLKSEFFSGVLIPGIEISTKVESYKIHLLAFLPSFDIQMDHPLLESLEKIRNSRIWRMKKMVERANKMGFDISYEEVLEVAGTGIEGDSQPTDVISRPHLARVIVKKGYAKDLHEVFDNYLADGKPLHIERFTLNFEEWIDLVHELHGLIIWAHPLWKGDEMSTDEFINLAEKIASAGIDGVERIYRYDGKYPVNEEFIRWGNEYLDKLIEHHDWLMTSGGDFHGDVGVLGELDLPKDDYTKFIDRLQPS